MTLYINQMAVHTRNNQYMRLVNNTTTANYGTITDNARGPHDTMSSNYDKALHTLQEFNEDFMRVAAMMNEPPLFTPQTLYNRWEDRSYRTYKMDHAVGMEIKPLYTNDTKKEDHYASLLWFPLMLIYVVLISIADANGVLPKVSIFIPLTILSWIVIMIIVTAWIDNYSTKLSTGMYNITLDINLDDYLLTQMSMKSPSTWMNGIWKHINVTSGEVPHIPQWLLNYISAVSGKTFPVIKPEITIIDMLERMIIYNAQFDHILRHCSDRKLYEPLRHVPPQLKGNVTNDSDARAIWDVLWPLVFILKGCSRIIEARESYEEDGEVNVLVKFDNYNGEVHLAICDDRIYIVGGEDEYFPLEGSHPGPDSSTADFQKYTEERTRMSIETLGNAQTLCIEMYFATHQKLWTHTKRIEA